ncbi:CHAD domain-containing protein [Solimonas sp. K1W22B-7]|uniref:CHAD domain-containing protein n=1 Tax=Solimonas sp. K1W22B-7 TaxID=2303331 RepID=UPI000E32E8A1|nr:CHAD domain-containing protein [Solimonas sp. K1W22B-7]AXQ30260.1 CHAD domain-containing protein [Solimonas sp. K1W22B-7]
MTGFALDPELSPHAALRGAALSELDRALAALRRGDARGVHETRKSCKRLRAWSRLLRDLPLPRGHRARHINGLLRDAGRALAAPREAAVALDTFDGLERPGTLPAPAWRQLGGALHSQAEAQRQLAAAALAAAEKALGEVRDLIAALPATALGPADLRRGQRKSYKRARKAFRRTATGDAEAMHEWRKRAKRLEAIQELLAPLLNPELVPRRLAELTDLLGQHHDLHELPLRPELGPEQRELLEHATESPRKALERRLERRGRALFQRG